MNDRSPRPLRPRSSWLFALALGVPCAAPAMAASAADELPPAVALGEISVASTTVAAIESVITADTILADVTHLASDEYYGRFFRSPFAFKAAEWIRVQFAAAGLAPGNPQLLGVPREMIEATLSKESAEGEPLAASDTQADEQAGEKPAPAAAPVAISPWFQPLADAEAAPNVIAVLPAREGSPHADRTILITAHYDHLPPKRRGEDRIFNGADDNASGVCGMIAIARALASLPQRLPCQVMFVAFTGEEAGLRGAKRFVEFPPVPISSIAAMFNLDMISRGEENLIFCDGRDFSEPIREALRAANAAVGLEIRFDTHPDWLDRSDQGPFLAKGVPAVLFSVEDHEDYHQVTDHADRILPGLAMKTSRLVALATLLVAEREATKVNPKASQDVSSAGRDNAASDEAAAQPAEAPK
ncbi:MAG: M20/M25/M40 family metallo-hydrolase [Phycisphaerales bacterium]